MLSLTDKAIKRFKELLIGQDGKNYGVRIFTAGAGCCGPSLAMDIADAPEKEDIILDKNSVRVFLEKEANNLLSEATIDFSDDRGFIISEMQQSSCCG